MVTADLYGVSLERWTRALRSAMTQKVRRNKRQKEKKTIDSLSFIKIKNSCASKDPKMKVKRPSANGEKKFANHI